MKAVILAAGEGKRMHPLTYTRPKVMVPLAGMPILEHVILEIKNAGINDFVIVVGYFDQSIREYFETGKKLGCNIEYMTQRKQLGTANAVKTVESLVEGNFLLANGDAIVKSTDIERIISRTKNTMGLVEMEDTTDMGVVEIEGESIVKIHEKVKEPPSNLINAGIYLLTPEIFSAIDSTPTSLRGEYELTDSLQLMINNGIKISYEMIGPWVNISYPWDMLTANEALLSEIKAKNDGQIEENVMIKGPVVIGQGTIIRSGAYIIGPVTIGKNCDIGPNCYIRPSTSIGNKCHIGNAVEIKNSIIMDNSNVPHHNYVGDSIIGENCNLGAGTKVANLKLDKKPISVGKTYTGRRKLGAIIGDNVQTGINSCLNIGCSIGNNSIIGPGVVARGIIRPKAKIF